MISSTLSKVSMEEAYSDYDVLEENMTTLTWCGGVKKQLIKEGNGGKIPRVTTIYAHYIRMCENEELPLSSTVTLGGYPQRFDMGFHFLTSHRGLFYCLMSMQVGEVAKFILSPQCSADMLHSPPKPVNENSPRVLLFLEVVKIVPGKSSGIEKMTAAEFYKLEFPIICAEVAHLNMEGEIFHESTDIEAALARFRFAYKVFQGYQPVDNAEERTHSQLLFTVYANAAVCYLHLNCWESCRQICLLAFHLPYPNKRILHNVYYRFAVSNFEQGYLKVSFVYCNKALIKEPKNKAFLELLDDINAKLRGNENAENEDSMEKNTCDKSVQTPMVW